MYPMVSNESVLNRLNGCDTDISRNTRKHDERGEIMKSGYESLFWINDKEGKEYVCTIQNNGHNRSFEDLTDEEKKRCENVNQIIGTARW